MQDTIFALDIGTRKIAGLVIKLTETGLVLLDSEMLEHKTRAMLDGQIHDVEAVAAAIRHIKNALEERLDIKLNQAAVAAAGRALKTAVGIIDKKCSVAEEITPEEVKALELEAVQQAQFQLAQEELGGRDKANYFCVGYSVMYYQLDGQEIGSLVGQVGSAISVKVIATFLPRVVVDSLFSSLKRAQLDVYSMTLEPIAALSVAIPPNMRLLNLALVDIGAGTSDIAIVKNGNIFAYAMVPMGGDELTEFLASQYLLDFDTAEILKRQLGSCNEVEVEDILGNKSIVATGEIIKNMQMIINDLGQNIAQNILELNQKAPDAVICVGGGSLTPGLKANLAEHLNIPVNRIGVRTPENFDQIKVEVDYLKGPQGVTPLGIAYNCCITSPVPFIKVRVNGRETVLWNTGGINIGQALLSSGISLNNIFGKPGLGKTIEVNGLIKVIKGKMGTPPVIKLNGSEVSLETIVKEGDEIEFAPGKDGEEARVYVRDLIPGAGGYVYVNDEQIKLEPVVEINGRLAGADDEVPDRAQVTFKRINSIANILQLAGVPEEYLQETVYHYYLNGQEMMVRWLPIEAVADGRAVLPRDTVDFDVRIYYKYRHLRPRIRDVIQNSDIGRIMLKVNGEDIIINSRESGIIMNGDQVTDDTELLEGAHIEADKSESSAILSDIFQVIDITPAASGRLVIKVNGKPAGFTTPIFNNDQIELSWE